MLGGLLALAGMAYGQQRWNDRKRGELAEGIKGLLGTPEGARAGEEGPVQIPGTGLLADPANVEKQMQFAQGLLGMRGGDKALQAFAPMLQQSIQSKQWKAGQDQQQSQFDTTDARLTDQFSQTKDWQKQEADRAQANWTKQFEQQAQQQAMQRQMEGARLALSQRNAAGEQAEREWRMKGGAAGGEAGKLPAGYGVVDTASGRSLMPMPGTENFGKAKAAEGALTNTIGVIDSLMDDYLGKEVTNKLTGKPERRDGMGSELWGPGYTQMNSKRGSIIAALGTAREMGVLDKNEYERLTKQLPEVDEITRSDKSFAAAYKGVRDEFARKLDTHRKANPWLVPPPPPGYH
jgi:hypothetical protein